MRRQLLPTRNRVAVRGKGGRLRSDNGAGRGRDDHEECPFTSFFLSFRYVLFLLLLLAFSLFLLNIDDNNDVTRPRDLRLDATRDVESG